MIWVDPNYHKNSLKKNNAHTTKKLNRFLNKKKNIHKKTREGCRYISNYANSWNISGGYLQLRRIWEFNSWLGSQNCNSLLCSALLRDGAESSPCLRTRTRFCDPADGLCRSRKYLQEQSCGVLILITLDDGSGWIGWIGCTRSIAHVRLKKRTSLPISLPNPSETD